MLKSFRNQTGASLVESMLAFALVAGSAVVLFPVFIATKREGKLGSAKQTCETIVRGKLDEYRFGRVVDLAAEAAASGRPQINNLSVATLSDTSISGLNSTTPGANTAPVTTVLGNGGFLYSKVRYNQYFPDSCRGTSVAAGNIGQVFGMGECIGDNRAWVDGAAAQNCGSNPVDSRIGGQMPGFKLYVKLERTSPWILGVSAGLGATLTNRFSDTCPNFGSAASPIYDFDGSGDGVQITVTGVIDYSSVGLADFGGIQDANRLRCSVSAIVRPIQYPIRYYVTRNGRIYTVQGHGLNGSESGGWVLGSLYRQSGGILSASGITSIAVHPRNLSVYALRPGMITRYSNCSGVPLDCNLTPDDDDGISDDGQAARPTVQEFPILSSIHSIGVDFRTGAVYGLSSNKTEVIRINMDDGAGAPVHLADCTTCRPGDAVLMLYETLGNSEFPKPIPAAAARLSGFFISPDGNEAYVSDTGTTAALGGGASYSTSIYRALDAQLSSPILVMPIAAVGFSK